MRYKIVEEWQQDMYMLTIEKGSHFISETNTHTHTHTNTHTQTHTHTVVLFLSNTNYLYN